MKIYTESSAAVRPARPPRGYTQLAAAHFSRWTVAMQLSWPGFFELIRVLGCVFTRSASIYVFFWLYYRTWHCRSLVKFGLANKRIYVRQTNFMILIDLFSLLEGKFKIPFHLRVAMHSSRDHQMATGCHFQGARCRSLQFFSHQLQKLGRKQFLCTGFFQALVMMYVSRIRVWYNLCWYNTSVVYDACWYTSVV